MIKDLYFGLVSRHIQDKRQDWDNLSDDVCYLNPDQAAQERATARERDRQRPLDQLTDAEKVAWKSPENCAKVCELEDVTDEEEDEIKAYPRTEHSEDTSFSDSADREARRKELDEKKRGRTCFQYRWHQEVCCTSKSFKLGSPMSKPSDKKDRWVSGWHLKGIKDWIETADKCTEPAWKNPELA